MTKETLYYKNPYLSEFDATVVKCQENEKGYIIILDNTAFYPEGGGQPSDTGHIGDSYISYVYEKDDIIYHVSDRPLETGKVYKCSINWELRFDYMQQHTAEHVVSGLIHKLYKADNVGFHIGESYVTIDFNKTFTTDDIEKIEYMVNEAVFKNIEVKVDYYDSTPDIEYRSKKELTGLIRIVTVPDYDICACCGTQLRTTGEIGLIKILDFQKYKSGTRLFIVSGYKALKDYQIKQKNAHEISEMLSEQVDEIASGVRKLLDERDSLKHDYFFARSEIIKHMADEIEPRRIIYSFKPDFNNNDMKMFLSHLGSKSELAAVFSGNDIDGYRYAISSRMQDFDNMVKRMNESLSGKGGGKGLAMGTVRCTHDEIHGFFNSL
ncbi:MAG: alanyl-tRNA editing protein [Clostridiales bacterium]|jgi:alanyl-tRNA synthetase|nr:alanyl-tRNA editing protein [Clostridiales bacterium]